MERRGHSGGTLPIGFCCIFQREQLICTEQARRKIRQQIEVEMIKTRALVRFNISIRVRIDRKMEPAAARNGIGNSAATPLRNEVPALYKRRDVTFYSDERDILAKPIADLRGRHFLPALYKESDSGLSFAERRHKRINICR